jgi:hypothetical protein
MSDSGTDDTHQGVARCDVCLGFLPCRDHPRPPTLTFAGGTSFAKNQQYKTEEATEIQDSGKTHDLKSPFDDAGWPLRDSPVDARPSEPAGEAGSEVRQQLPGDVPVSVEQDNVVEFSGATRLDIKPEKILEGALKHCLKTVIVLGIDLEGAEYFAYSTGAVQQLNWMLDRAKLEVMMMYIDDREEDYPNG